MLSHFFRRHGAKVRPQSAAGRRRRLASLQGVQQLETRQLLAQLSNAGLGRLEAFLEVEVNEYGAFGNALALDVSRSDVPDGNDIDNAFYDLRDTAPPNPPIESVGYAYESAIALGVNFQAPGYTREFLTAGCVNYRPTRFTATELPSNNCGDIREGDGYTAPNNSNDAEFDQFSNPPQGDDNRTSVFYYPNGSDADNADIRITLQQELIEHTFLGGPSGTSLVQTYELEILSASINTLEIVRYMDADVFEPGGPVLDGGGHRLIGVTIDQDAVFTTDDATNTPLNDNSIVELHENHVDHGGYPQLGTNRWEIGRATGNDANGFDFVPPWPPPFPFCPVLGFPDDPCKTHPWLDIWPVSTYEPPDANGEAIKPRARPIVRESPYLVARIMAGAPLANDITVNGGWTGRDFNGQIQTYGQPGWDTVVTDYDSDNNGVIDRGVPADVSMAMSNQYVNVNLGDRIVYEVFTKFGHPPIGTPPTPPTTADLSGRVFADLNGNGTFDTGERGLQGWTVFNDRNGNGNIDPGEIQDQTDSDGVYLLKLPENIPPQPSHNIALIQRANWAQTVPIGTGLTAPGSYGPIDVTANDLGTRLMPGDYGFATFNFGLDPDPSSIFGTVFDDDNANGTQDAGEAPLPNWPVFSDLNHDGAAQPNETVLTDANGRYSFGNLDPGTYTVTSAPINADYERTTPASGQFTVTVGAGAIITPGDFGFRLRRATISGFKFNDLNGNGVRDQGEPPLAGIFIYLDLTNDGILNLGDRSSVTNSQGRFTFQDVRPRVDTTVAESLALGMTQTFPIDDNGTYIVNLEPGELRDDLLFGNRFITVDYGDAPPPYPTSIQQAGPQHEIDPDFRLGATVTAEIVPIINATATGDASDDGVVFNGILTPGATATIQVTAQPAGGLLQAWIDFNRDGDWADTGEQILSNQALAAGVNTLNVSVPADAVGGITFARYRYGSQMNLGITGLATDGEVEDYQYTIAGGDGGIPVNWTNPGDRFDVDANGSTTLSDVLVIVNALRSGGARDLPPPSEAQQPPPYYDVNQDNRLTLSDALEVVRRVILIREGLSEGEAPAAMAAATEQAKSSSSAVSAAPSEASLNEMVLPDDRHLAIQAELATCTAGPTAPPASAADGSESDELDLDGIAADVATAWSA